MKINPEAQLAVKLYNRIMTMPDHAPYHAILSSTLVQINSCRDAAKLTSMARSLRRLYTSECNDNLPEPTRSKRTHRIISLQEAVIKILSGYQLCGMRSMDETFNDEPRGYAVKIHFPDGSYNTMGGQEDGWGI